jgi:HK97 family phage major capsid protein
MEYAKLNEAQERLTAKQNELAGIFKEAGPDLDMSKVKSLGDSADVVDHIRNLNAELDELGKSVKDLTAVRDAAVRTEGFEAPAVEKGDEAGESRRKSFGRMFVESEAFKMKAGGQGPQSHIDMDVKALFETTAGWAPESTRSGLVVLDAQREVQVTDLLPQVPTSQSAYKYMEETTFTNGAVEKAEGTAYGEAALALTERSVPVEKVTVWLPVTDEQLEDESGAEAYINARLPFMLRQRLDAQILTGTGVTPLLLGINEKPSINTQAKGADPVPDAIHKGITKARVTGRARPNAVVFHDNDWQDVRLLRTTDGIYIWGNPADAGPERIWGLQVVKSDAQTEHTAIVGDFANYSLLAIRRGIDVQVSNSHASYFVEGKQAIRADIRVAVVWTRPEAFTEVTGI